LIDAGLYPGNWFAVAIAHANGRMAERASRDEAIAMAAALAPPSIIPLDAIEAKLLHMNIVADARKKRPTSLPCAKPCALPRTSRP
jgi:hypothetical protein